MSFEGKKILIAEDNEGMLEIIRAWLEHVEYYRGAKILVARTAEEAEAYLLEEEPEMTILDIGLGNGFPGIDIIRKVQGELPARCKIFVFSGYPEYAQECLDAGAVAFIKKGTRFHEMHDIIQKHFSAN